MVDEVVSDHGLLMVPDEAPLFRRLASEFVGTALLVAVGAGTATVLALGPLRRLAGLSTVFGESPTAEANNQVFGTLLGTSGASLGDVLGVAFAFAFILAILVYALGGVSGGHFNPAVTFSLAAVRRFKWSDVPFYWIAQVLGGIAGAFLIAVIYGKDGATFQGTDILFGATSFNDATTNFYQALASEAFITFVLVLAIMAVAVDPRAPKGWSGLVIGLALGGGILFTAFATGGSANFARSLGPLVASLVYDAGNIPWGDLTVYALGPLIGGTAAAFIYESLTGLERIAPAPQPGAATPEVPLDTVEEPLGSGDDTGV